MTEKINSESVLSIFKDMEDHKASYIAYKNPKFLEVASMWASCPPIRKPGVEEDWTLVDREDYWYYLWSLYAVDIEKLQACTGLTQSTLTRIVPLMVEAKLLYPDGSTHAGLETKIRVDMVNSLLLEKGAGNGDR